MPCDLRERFEEHHAAWLSPCAVRESDSGGRRHDEPEHPYRTCYQRDRDRVVHSTAFRRLDFKTQVFVPHEHDHFRTRLTHTLEVAQIARNLGRALRLNEDLIEAVALAHDLGHPPFGHAGEEVLADLMAGHGGFEHNRQSLRIADYLEHPYPDFRGLNLTAATRECLAKHETRYDRPDDMEFAGTGRAPLEGQLVDLSDEIAYTSADLEDALTAGWINARQLGELALWRRAWDEADRAAPGAGDLQKRLRACKNVLAIVGDDLVRATGQNIRSLGLDSVQAVRLADRKAVALSGNLAADFDALKDFLLRAVYLDDRCRVADRNARRMLTDLFTAYVADPSLLPERYRSRVGTAESPSVHRVACDYIAGMTDRFCSREHEKVCGRS